MSTPTTHVSAFNGSSPGWMLSGPERYGDGLWLEEGTVNLVRNPIALATAANWADNANRDEDRVTPLPVPLLGWLEEVIVTGMQATAAASLTGGQTALQPTPTFALGSATPHTLSGGVLIPSNWSSSGNIGLFVSGFTGASGATNALANLGVRDAWQWLALTFTPDAGDLSGDVSVRVFANGWVSGESLFATGLQMEAKPYATSLALSHFGDGYSAGTNTHIRAAASAAISPSGILSPASGAIAARIAPTIETGLEEFWGECGTKGAGTDHIQWGRDATKHPFVEWSSDDGSYQRLTSVETADAGIEHFMLIGHDGTDLFIKAAGGARESGTRDAVEGSFGAGDLVLKASVGGNVVGSLATFNRMLTDAEIYTVEHTEHWSMGMLGNEMVRRIRAQFELRPAY